MNVSPSDALAALPMVRARLALEKERGARPIWSPNPGGQTMVRDSLADWVYFGGQAGGGKSYGGLGLAATMHKSSVIFRREFTDLKGAEGLIEVSRKMHSAVGVYNANDHVWRVTTAGVQRYIEFAGIQGENDKYAQQGRARDLYVFDEVSQFTRAQVQYVTGWLRSNDPNQRCRILLQGNPPTTAEGLWVVSAFAPWLDPTHPRKAQPGELRWFVAGEQEDIEVEGPEAIEVKGEMRKPHSRTYIPSILKENPTYANGAYAKTLDAMPEPFRSQLKHGDFTIGMKDDALQVIPTEWVRAAQTRWTPERPPRSVQTQLGVDLAHGGIDWTTIVRRFGSWLSMPEKVRGVETDTGQKAAARIAAALVDGGFANVDVIGVGASAFDAARAMGLPVMPVNFGAGCDRHDASRTLTFANMRAWAYWRLREMLDPGAKEPLALPPHPEVLGDLTSPRFSVLVSGIQIEAKDDIRKRIGRSPDVGDAIVLACLPIGGGHDFKASIGDHVEYETAPVFAVEDEEEDRLEAWA